MSQLQKWLSAGPLITDGAWGTELLALGLAPGALPDAWNLERPDRVESVARAYVEAGSQVILTNTFRSNGITLEEAGLAGQLAAINRAGVEISKRAAAGKALVFASIGPTGKLLMNGEVGREEVAAAFAAQAAALAEAGADALLIETMSDIEEAGLALSAAQSTGLPVIVSFAFDSGKNKDRTMMGVTPEAAARAMESAGADAVGANCGAGIERFVPVCERLKAACSLPVWIKANAGLPEMQEGAVVYSTPAGVFASYLPALVEAGAAFIGGCCGTTPGVHSGAGRGERVETSLDTAGMSACATLEIRPEPNRSLADRLFELGVEFPCGGESACGGCKIRVLSGHVPITATMRQACPRRNSPKGWRLACCAEAARERRGGSGPVVAAGAHR
jgi:5-methyltetrahydrofolate--homocysteine methyltransferase